MSYYRGTADGGDKAKAIGAVLLVHAGLGAMILTGLNVDTVSRTIDSLKTFDITPDPPPPPPPPPPPKQEASKAKQEEGAAGKKAIPTEVVAPKAKLPVKPKIAAAPVAGTGSASSAGAANAGSGTGAGGSGSGLGGGGSGPDYSRFTPARLVRNLSRSDYRTIAQGRLPAGSAATAIDIDPNGAVSGCRLLQSSGDPIVDSGLCPLIRARLRFRPALDDRGRPVRYNTNFLARWSI